MFNIFNQKQFQTLSKFTFTTFISKIKMDHT